MPLDNTDKKLLNLLQQDFPMVPQPFQSLADRLSLNVSEVLDRTRRLKFEEKIIRQISAIFDSRQLGYKGSLVAVKAPPACVDEAAQIINAHPGVSHNYKRNHEFNLWYTLTVHPQLNLEGEANKLAERAHVTSRLMPTLRLFKIGVKLDMTGEHDPSEREEGAPQRIETDYELTRQDIRVILELQKDIDIVERPFQQSAEAIDLSEEELLDRGQFLKDNGFMRRYAAVLHHRRAGFGANGMGVWKVPEDRVNELGPVMASFASVSHCYRRPTYPDWPYTLFTMIHARSMQDCRQVAEEIARATNVHEYDLLFSTKEYKKTRVQYFTEDFVQQFLKN